MPFCYPFHRITKKKAYDFKPKSPSGGTLSLPRGCFAAKLPLKRHAKPCEAFLCHRKNFLWPKNRTKKERLWKHKPLLATRKRYILFLKGCYYKSLSFMSSKVVYILIFSPLSQLCFYYTWKSFLCQILHFHIIFLFFMIEYNCSDQLR